MRVAKTSQWGGANFWVFGSFGRSFWAESFGRSQKFLGLGAEPPAAEGQWGLGAKTPAAGGWGSGREAPSRRRHRGLGAEPPALENFAFFLQK